MVAVSKNANLVCAVLVVFGFSIGGAAGCPKDAREKDQADDGYDQERGSDHSLSSLKTRLANQPGPLIRRTSTELILLRVPASLF